MFLSHILKIRTCVAMPLSSLGLVVLKKTQRLIYGIEILKLIAAIKI